MMDPVIAADGQTYERSAFQRYLETFGRAPPRSPVTGELLEHKYLLPNLALRALLDTQ